MNTHKTASNELLNILFHFGQKLELKFAFPNGHNDFHYPSYLARSLVQDYRPGACFNIICNHMRFHYKELRGLVRPGATFITIICDSAPLFQSLLPLLWICGAAHLGYYSSLDPGSPCVQEHILEVEHRFHLVLLQEYIDESLVLHGELLCWDLEDMLYFKLNALRDSPVLRLLGELYRPAIAWGISWTCASLNVRPLQRQLLVKGGGLRA